VDSGSFNLAPQGHSLGGVSFNLAPPWPFSRWRLTQSGSQPDERAWTPIGLSRYRQRGICRSPADSRRFRSKAGLEEAVANGSATVAAGELRGQPLQQKLADRSSSLAEQVRLTCVDVGRPGRPCPVPSALRRRFTAHPTSTGPARTGPAGHRRGRTPPPAPPRQPHPVECLGDQLIG
jgi:hypothetical protein